MNEHHLFIRRLGATPAAPTPAVEPLLPAGRIERARMGQVVTLQLLDRVMKGMSTLVAEGFVPIGFRADVLEGVVLRVEPPADEVIERGRYTVTGVYAPGVARQWTRAHGVRVEWDYGREGPLRHVNDEEC